MFILNIIKKYGLKPQSIGINKLTNDTSVLLRKSRVRQLQGLLLHASNIHTQEGPPWSVLFFGTDDFALQSLKKLHSK